MGLSDRRRDDHRGRHETQGDAGSNDKQPRKDRDQIAGLAWCVGKPQLTGGEYQKADDKRALRTKDA
jgi:hypothetical protein